MNREGLVWGGLALLIVLLALMFRTEGMRLWILRGLLVGIGITEAIAAFANVFRVAAFSERNGRRYDPVYHGTMQDFGFYNLAIALLLIFSALDPVRNILIIHVALVLYLVHGVAHLARFRGAFFGGETRVRARDFELRDALPLLTAEVGLLLFYPLSSAAG